MLGATCIETAGYSLCAEEACAFSHAFCTHLRYGVTALKNKYTMYSVVLSTRQMFAFSSKDPVLVRNHSFFHNIKLLINMCTMRVPLILNLEIQSSSGIILCSYQISFFRASQYCITMIIYLPAFLVGRATITSPPRKKGN